MVGSALVRRLKQEPCEVLTAGREHADFTRQDETETLMNTLRPDAVIIAAARVGGIMANKNAPAHFLYDNLMIASHLIHASHKANVDRLLFLGSSCIYPRMAPQPIDEDALLTGPLEPTNDAYAIAKIAGIKLAQSYKRQYGRAYISAMPTNLFGPGDNFDPETSHVLPALIHKVHNAKISGAKHITIWGSGTPMREFMHADDCADALIFALKHYNDETHINIGTGQDITILELTQIICGIIGFDGEIKTDTSKPDGTPRKLMSSKRLNDLGWAPKTSLKKGIYATYKWYLENITA